MLALFKELATHPNNRGFLGRRHRADLKVSTLQEWEDIVPPHWIAHVNQAEQKWTLKNGSQLWARPLDKPQRSRGPNLGVVAVDECNEITLETFKTLRSRLRLPGIPGRFLAATNPAGLDHWLYHVFIDPSTRDPDSEHFTSSTLENVFVPLSFRLDMLRSTSGAERNRLVYGAWEDPENRIWNNASTGSSLIEPFDIPANWLRERSIDFGFEHYFACLWGAWDPDKPRRMVVYREYLARRRSLEDHARAIHKLEQNEPKGARWGKTWADHDEQDRFELGRLPPPLRILTARAKKARGEGFAACNKAFMPQRDGYPNIFVTKDCPVTWAQIIGLKRPDPPKPSQPDANVTHNSKGISIDDAASAFRYLYFSRLRSDFQAEPEYVPGVTTARDRSRLYRQWKRDQPQ